MPLQSSDGPSGHLKPEGSIVGAVDGFPDNFKLEGLNVEDVDSFLDQFKLKGSNHFKLEGSNIGATSTIGNSPTGESLNCCTINIYVNNNVQGISNSIVLGSEVTMRDPGAHLSFRGLNMNRGSSEQRALKKKNAEGEMKESKLGFVITLVSVAVGLLLMMLLL
uniref:Uncharacterized protein n=1 Tax=Nelumbo nucifera TaxID=4432 RepID=A0A822XJ99_NELNU|nr:TPA_asm: hypothetical protein HUJ06_021545 [Nelumbo nucifera]